jgi:hypothetical protein
MRAKGARGGAAVLLNVRRLGGKRSGKKYGITILCLNEEMAAAFWQIALRKNRRGHGKSAAGGRLIWPISAALSLKGSYAMFLVTIASSEQVTITGD